MSYKYSQFNVVLHGEKGAYLWNTASDFVVALDNNAARYVESFRSGDIICEDSPYFKTMLRDRFIVKEQIDEYGMMLRNQDVALFSNQSVLSITIAPGMNCNYNCVYCFENGNRSGAPMSSQTIQDVISYIEKKATSNTAIKKFTLYGSEENL